MKIFVAMPVYDGKVQFQTVNCLLTETLMARELGDEIRFNCLPSCAVPAYGRNQLVQYFMDSDCDKLVFLDSDLTFPMGSILKLAHHPVDFVAGCYRFKMKHEMYPINFVPGMTELWADKNGLLEMETLPTGFMCLSRKVFETFQKEFPDRTYEHFGSKQFCYFQMVYAQGMMHSEDSYFCKEWIKTGGKVFLDPEIELTHWDMFPTPFQGHIGNWLKTRNNPVQKAETNFELAENAHEALKDLMAQNQPKEI